MKRIFLIVLDSVGIGEMPDAADYKDVGSNTLKAASTSQYFSMANMERLGLFQIDGMDWYHKKENDARKESPQSVVARMKEASKGKDTTIGHWEISGIQSNSPLPTYPDGFPKEILDEFSRKTGRGILCNKPYSGTDVIRDYGQEHLKTGDLIVYTSADSVFQIAAHEEVVSVEKLYSYCQIARDMLVGDHGVGRVIARPFTGSSPNFSRTANRHDYSMEPPKTTMLDQLAEQGLGVIGVGKINDIFAGKGISESVRTASNEEGINRIIEYAQKEFRGLCFINLVDYDMLYGHRNDVDGYAKALTDFDRRLPEIIENLKEEDLLMITADHGCDPSTPSTDHSREYTPFLMLGQPIKKGKNLGTRDTFADIGATVLDYFQIPSKISGKSML